MADVFQGVASEDLESPVVGEGVCLRGVHLSTSLTGEEPMRVGCFVLSK
jgi:hypothetical protein